MRLWLLLPRGGGGGSLRGLSRGRLALAAAALAAAALLLISAGDVGRPAPVGPAPSATAAPDPLASPAAARSLAIGITEPNPNFVTTDPRGEPWSRWRDALARLDPALYRLVLDWPALQPAAGAAAELERFETGCMRATPPCGPWRGVREQLRALAQRQRLGGWQALVVVTGSPDWAAVPPSGCEAADTRTRSRAPGAAALPGYRALVERVLAVARQEGAELRYWSAWNEPNHPYFLAPQRANCDPLSTSLAPGAYAPVARALAKALAAAPGDQQLVLGELAGLTRARPDATSVSEFIGALPRDLVCSTPIWSQHAYVGGTDPVDVADAALAGFRCPRRHAIWITETGVGPAPRGLSAARGIAGEVAACRALHRRLEAWWRDPRVPIAVQYTLREDDQFRTGLVTTDLARARPALAEWIAWGGGREPAAPAPASTCPSR